VKHDSRRHPSVVLFPVDRQSPQEFPNVLHRFEARLLRLGLAFAFAFGTGTVLGLSLSQLHRIGKPPWVQNVMGPTSGRGWRSVWGKERHTVQPRMKWGATVRRRFELVCGATKLCAVNPWGTDTKPGVDITREAQMGRRKQSESRPTWRGGNFSPQLRKFLKVTQGLASSANAMVLSVVPLHFGLQDSPSDAGHPPKLANC
jgi:hypothetical protein